MTLESLAKMGQEYGHSSLAALDADRLKAMRNASLRACFNRIEDTPFRIEPVARIIGREYINDAAARTPNATWYALETLQGGLIWIACGSDHPVDYSKLVPSALRKVRMLLVLGPDEQLRNAFKDAVHNIQSCSSLSEALHLAYLYDAQDVSVLFSPATDEGIPSRVWGERFRHEVNEL